MNRVTVQSSWYWVCLAALAAGAVLAGPALAQESLPEGDDPGKELSAGEGKVELQKKFDKNSKRLAELIKGKDGQGNAAVPTAKDMDAIKVAAGWYTLRLTWRQIKNPPRKGMPNIAKVHQELDVVLRDIDAASKNNEKFRQLFIPELAANLKAIFEQGTRYSRIHAALMLHRLAQTGEQLLVKAHVAVLKNTKYEDAMKLYALKGLKILLAKMPAAPQKEAERKAFNDRYGPAVKELLDIIAKSPSIPKGTTPAESVRVKRVYQYLRREAIRAVAQVKMPALAVGKDGKTVEGPIAYQLLRVVANDKMNPPATLSERVEAAIGLLQYSPDPASPVQTDLTLYFIGELLRDLATDFNLDVVRTGSRLSNPRKKTDPRSVRAEPWLVYAYRFQHALDQLETAAKDAPTKAKINKFRSEADAILSKMKPKNPNVQVGDLGAFRKVIEKLKPKNTSVYKGVDGYKVKEKDLED
jgi:hypothetical protein